MENASSDNIYPHHSHYSPCCLPQVGKIRRDRDWRYLTFVALFFGEDTRMEVSLLAEEVIQKRYNTKHKLHLYQLNIREAIYLLYLEIVPQKMMCHHEDWWHFYYSEEKTYKPVHSEHHSDR
jgi:hypothetical protein